MRPSKGTGVATVGQSIEHRPIQPSLERRHFRPVHYLAALGLLFLFWQGWTYTAWLADHPHQITQFRDRNSASWYAARAYEVLFTLVAIVVLVYLVRLCRRERRLAFDAKLAIALAACIWTDPGVNFIQPTW